MVNCSSDPRLAGLEVVALM